MVCEAGHVFISLIVHLSCFVNELPVRVCCPSFCRDDHSFSQWFVTYFVNSLLIKDFFLPLAHFEPIVPEFPLSPECSVGGGAPFQWPVGVGHDAQPPAQFRAPRKGHLLRPLSGLERASADPAAGSTFPLCPGLPSPSLPAVVPRGPRVNVLSAHLYARCCTRAPTLASTVSSKLLVCVTGFASVDSFEGFPAFPRLCEC